MIASTSGRTRSMRSRVSSASAMRGRSDERSGNRWYRCAGRARTPRSRGRAPRPPSSWRAKQSISASLATLPAAGERVAEVDVELQALADHAIACPASQPSAGDAEAGQHRDRRGSRAIPRRRRSRRAAALDHPRRERGEPPMNPVPTRKAARWGTLGAGQHAESERARDVHDQGPEREVTGKARRHRQCRRGTAPPRRARRRARRRSTSARRPMPPPARRHDARTANAIPAVMLPSG